MGQVLSWGVVRQNCGKFFLEAYVLHRQHKKTKTRRGTIPPPGRLRDRRLNPTAYFEMIATGEAA